MKKLFAAALAAIASIAFGATTTPIQLLSPTGSAAGQAILSTGPSSYPAWGVVGIAGGGTGATTAANARTNLGLGTMATQSATSVSISGGAINGAAIANGTLSGASITGSPISGAAGSFTTLAATGLISPASTIGIAGTVTNDSAQAGSVGEFKSGTTSGTSLTTSTAAACASVSLTAGDWDVSGNIRYNPAGTTTISGLSAGISTTATSQGGLGAQSQTIATLSTGQSQLLVTPIVRESLSATTTIYLTGYAIFGTSTMTCDGMIRARRIR